MDTIGVLSILEDSSYKEVKRLWKLFETKYHSVGVQKFNYPNITFQGGTTSNLNQLRKDFKKLVLQIDPFEIGVNGIGHFGKKTIFLNVKKSNELVVVNKIICDFLKIHCRELFELYLPKSWVPHITLAMDDLTSDNFESLWDELSSKKINFQQTLHNICIVKMLPSGKVIILDKHRL
jgi:2'-5' RNA ligase